MDKRCQHRHRSNEFKRGTFESRAATFIANEGASGTINISGGTYNAIGNGWGSFRIADYGTGTGTVNLSGTGVVNAGQYTAVGVGEMAY